jgi:hypothetical protein
MATDLNKEEIHSTLKGYVEEFLDFASDSMHDRAEKARDYYDGYQWTEREVRILENRKQPPITINRIKPKVLFLKGMETQNRTDPKALPRTPNDDKSGEVSTDALRYVEEVNRSDYEFSDGFENYIIEGVEAHEVIVEPNTKGQLEVVHNRLFYDRIFWDIHSRMKNFSDATYLGTFQWMDEKQARIDFKGAPEEFFNFEEDDGTTNDDNTFSDKPMYFIDKSRKRVRVFFCYFLHKNVWHYAVFSGGGFAVPPKPSPYLNEDGDPEPQFVFRAAFVDRNGNRYGEVESYLDIQDEINKRRSKLLHFLSVRQTWGNKGAVEDVQAHKREMSKPDGHLEFNIGEWGKEFGIVPTNDMAAGQMQLLIEAKSEIDVQGANSVLQGDVPQPLSGRAVQSLQQGGVVDLGSLFDGHRECKNRVYRMIFNRIKQFWTEERWVRVLGDENKLRWTGLNRPLTVRDVLLEQGVPEEELPQGDPRLDQPAIINGRPVIQNPVNELDVDIMVDEAADTLSLQHEQFELLVKMYQANPQAIDFKLLIRASQLRNKDELIRMLEGGTDEQQAALIQAQQQEQQEAKQIAMLAETVKIERDKAAAEKDLASADKMTQETQKIAVETAIELEEVTNPGQIA